MKYEIGQKVSLVIEPRIVMLIDTIQIPERYHCHWFIKGQVEESWFGSAEIEPAKENGNIGFRKQDGKAE